MSDSVCVCIPTLNEGEGVGEVVSGCISNGYSNILVIDGGSDDGTVEVAKEAGAEVRTQEYVGGKGAAMREAFDVTDADILVFLDGDGTYNPDHIDRIVEPISEDGYDQTIGNRFASMDDNAMKLSHKFGNRTVNAVFRVMYGKGLVDILSGFRGVAREAYEELDIQSSGFDIETEMAAKAVRNNQKVLVVPTSYHRRAGESKLSKLRDGVIIGRRLLSSRFD